MNAIAHRTDLRRIFLFGVITAIMGLCWLYRPAPVLAQTPTQPNPDRCYAVANVDQDRLYQIDPIDGKPSDDLEVSLADPTTTLMEDPTDPQGGRKEDAPTDIEALAFAPARSGTGVELYAASERNFGVLELATGVFTLIGDGFDPLIGTEFVNVDGIAYDWDSKRMFGATRRRAPGVADLFFEIDMATGKAVPNAFGAGVHYVEMKTSDGQSDLDDITFDPSTGVLYGVMNEKGDNVVLVTIDPANGAILTVAYIINGGNAPVYDIEGLTFRQSIDATGALVVVLYGTSGYNLRTDLNRIYRIDIDKATGDVVATQIQDLATTQLQDTEAIACTPPSPEPAMQFIKYCQGADANLPQDAPIVADGQTLTWTYVVTNTGETELNNVTVTDVPLGPISCPKDTLAPGEVMTCEKTGDTSGQDGNGLIANVGTVTAEGGGQSFEISDPSHCRVERTPAIELVKYCQGVDANDPNGLDVPIVADGQTITWTYVVTNTGQTELNKVTVTDVPLGPISCPKDTLAPGEVMTCDKTGDTSGQDGNGLIANTATVVGCAVGIPSVPPCTGSAQVTAGPDPSHCRVLLPDIAVSSVMTFAWGYLVSNPVVIDAVDLLNVVLDPDRGSSSIRHLAVAMTTIRGF